MSYFPKYVADQPRGLRFCLAIGLLFGLLVGALGIVQTLFTAATWAQNLAAEATRFPPGYTGYRDGTNLYRGIEWYWIDTTVITWFAELVLCFEAARIVAKAYQERLMGLLCALVVGVTGWIVFLVVNRGLLIPHLDLPHEIVGNSWVAASGVFDLWSISLSLGGTLFACALAGMVGAEAGTPPRVPVLPIPQAPPVEPR